MELVTLTRHTSAATNSYNLPIKTTTEIVLRAAVTPRTTTTTVGASEVSVGEGLTLYLPSGTTVLDDDLFTVRGVVYSIDGEAFDWKSGLGNWNPGTVVHIQRLVNG